METDRAINSAGFCVTSLKPFRGWLSRFSSFVFLLQIAAVSGASAEIEGFIGFKLGQSLPAHALEAAVVEDGLAKISIQPSKLLPHIDEYTVHVDRKTNAIAKLTATTAEIDIDRADALFRGFGEAISKKYGPMLPVRPEGTSGKGSSPATKVVRFVESGRSITLYLEPFVGRRVRVIGQPERSSGVTRGKVQLVYSNRGNEFREIPKIEISPDDV